jgi:hypothetical protein
LLINFLFELDTDEAVDDGSDIDDIPELPEDIREEFLMNDVMLLFPFGDMKVSLGC